MLYEQLNGIGNFYQWLLAVLAFHGITCSVDGEQLDHERNSDVLNSKNEVATDKIDHKHYSDVVNAHVRTQDITDEEMDK